MKNLTLILLLLISPIMLAGQNLKALDDKYGFREAKFETPIDSYKNFVEIEKGIYKSTTEILNIGEYTLDEVAYFFYNGQLSTIAIRTKGYLNSRGFLSILQEAYGMGYQRNKNIERYSWLGEKVTMSYNQNSATGDASIFIYSIKLSDLEKAEKKKAIEAAKKL